MGTEDFSVRELAFAYRRLVLWFGAQLVAGVLSLVVPRVDGVQNPLITIVVLITVVALAYYGYRTAKAMGSSVGWLWAVAMFIPCLNVITLLVLSHRATKACRERGVPVGFLGPEVPDHEPGEAEVFGPNANE